MNLTNAAVLQNLIKPTSEGGCGTIPNVEILVDKLAQLSILSSVERQRLQTERTDDLAMNLVGSGVARGRGLGLRPKPLGGFAARM